MSPSAGEVRSLAASIIFSAHIEGYHFCAEAAKPSAGEAVAASDVQHLLPRPDGQ